MTGTVLEAALGYAARGMPVLPLNGKAPAGLLVPHGVHDATTDERQIRAWFTGSESLNIGIACGHQLVVLDVDPRNDPQHRALGVLVGELGELPPGAVRVATGGGGTHLYFTGSCASVKPHPWLDVKGHGGYVVAPPSVHPDTGKQYVMLDDPGGPLPALPARFQVAHRPVGEWKGLLGKPIPEGERHTSLTRLAGGLLAGGMSAEDTARTVLAINREDCRPPLPEAEVAQIVSDLAAKDRAKLTAGARGSDEMMVANPLNGDKSTTTIISGIKTVGQLVVEAAEVDWLWHGYLAPGAITLLAAKPKVGKSTLTFALLRALETGGGLIGLPTRRVCALYVSEESEAQLARKAAKVGLGEDWHLMLSRSQAHGVTWAQLVEGAGRVAIERGCEVVVFDTFNGLARLRGDDENKSGATLAALDPIQRLKDEGLGVLLVAHERKSDGAGGDTVRGSNALTGEVDIIVTLSRPNGADKTHRRLDGTGRFDETPATRDVDFDPATGAYSMTDPPVIAKAGKRQAEGAEKLRALPCPVTAKEYAAHAGSGERAAKRTLDKLVDGGEAVRTGTGTKSDPYRYAPPRMMVVVASSPVGDGDDDHPHGAGTGALDPPDDSDRWARTSCPDRVPNGGATAPPVTPPETPIPSGIPAGVPNVTSLGTLVVDTPARLLNADALIARLEADLGAVEITRGDAYHGPGRSRCKDCGALLIADRDTGQPRCWTCERGAA